MSDSRLPRLRLALCGTWAGDGSPPFAAALLDRLTALGHEVAAFATGAEVGGAASAPLVRPPPTGAPPGFDLLILLPENAAGPDDGAATLLERLPGLLILRADPAPGGAGLEALAARAAGVALLDPALLGRVRAACPGPVTVLPSAAPPEALADALLSLIAAVLEARPLLEAAGRTGRDLARWGMAPEDPAAARVAVLWDQLFGAAAADPSAAEDAYPARPSAM